MILSIIFVKNVIKVCYNLVDQILEGSDLCGYLTQAVDVILCHDVSVLQVNSGKCLPFEKKICVVIKVFIGQNHT